MKKFAKSFLQKASDKVLIMTTFSLDGDVVYEILLDIFKDGKWPKHLIIVSEKTKTRRLVFLREKLRGHKCSLTAIRCKVKNRIQRRYYPVFHSKIWIIVDEDENVETFAITSANLSRFHLEIGGGGPEETFCAIDENIPRGFYRALCSMFPFPKHPNRVRKTKQILLKTYRGVFCKIHYSEGAWAIESLPSSEPLKIFENGKWKVASHLKTFDLCGKGDIEYFTSSKNRLIHAKLYHSKELTIIGSPNITRNAWSAFNHETALFLEGNSDWKKNFSGLKKIERKKDVSGGINPEGIDPTAYEADGISEISFVRCFLRAEKMIIVMKVAGLGSVLSKLSYVRINNGRVKLKRIEANPIGKSKLKEISFECMCKDWLEESPLGAGNILVTGYTDSGEELFVDEDLFMGLEAYEDRKREAVPKKRRKVKRKSGKVKSSALSINVSKDDVRSKRDLAFAYPDSDSGRFLFLQKELPRERPRWIDDLVRISNIESGKQL